MKNNQILKRTILGLCTALVFSPANVFAYKRDTTLAKANAPSQPQAEAEPQTPPQQPPGKSEDEYENQMKSAQALITSGIVLSIGGGLAAVAGSTVALASSKRRTLGLIIGSSGLGLTVIGGGLTMWGSHKRNTAESYSLAPVIEPESGLYALNFAVKF